MAPSGDGHRSEKAPAAESRVTSPEATSTRKAGARPFSSATKYTAEESGAHTGLVAARGRARG